MSEKTEAQIQHDVIMWLQEQKVFCFHVANEAMGRSKVAQMQLVGMGLRAGVADLVVFWPDGHIGFVEMKDRKGKQSQKQKVFEKICVDYGTTYDICRSVDDVACLFRKYS